MTQKTWRIEKEGTLSQFPGEFEDVACNFCGSLNRKIIASVKDFETYKAGLFTNVQCLECGLIYLAPRPTQQTLMDHFYPADYTCYGRQSVGLFDYLRMIIVCKPKVKLIKRLCSNKKIRLLDVGCGDGKLLSYMRRKTDWDVQGIDPNPVAVKFAQEHSINVVQASLNDSHFPNDEFDVITMCQVIEHVPFPFETLKEVNRLLKSGGYLISENPNYGGLECRLFNKNWWGYHAPRHLFQFSYAMFEKMAEKAGFRVVEIRSKRRPGGIAWSFECFLIDKGVPQNIARYFGLNNPLMALLFSIPELLISLFDKTSMMEVVCQKN